MNESNPPPRTLRAASVQMESAPGNKTANLDKLEALTERATAAGARLVVFPECCISGYWFIRKLSAEKLRELAEPMEGGPSVQRVAELARRLQVSIGAGLIEATAGGELYNSYFVACPDGSLHGHRKLHAFEHPLIRCGDQFTVFDLPGGFRAGLLICYDCNLVENVRINALRGAEILIAPHQTGGCRTKNPHLMGLIERRVWECRHGDPEAISRELRGDKGRAWLMRWLPSRAHDNGIFVIFSNGIGLDDDEIRTGNAMILDPYGRILAESSAAADDVVIADLDGTLIPASTGRGWIRARRPDLYRELCVPTGLEREARQLKFEQ